MPLWQLARSRETFAERLMRLRRESGLSQRALAAGTPISYSYISRLESGDRLASIRAIRIIAPKLGVSPEYLESGVELTEREQLELRLDATVVAQRLGEATADAFDELRTVIDAATALPDADLAARARIALGLSALEARDHVAAASHLEQALASPIAIAAAYPEAHTGLARAYHALGRPTEAVRIVSRALTSLDQPGPADTTARLLLLGCLAEIPNESGAPIEASAGRTRHTRGGAPADAYARARTRAALARAAWAAGRPRTAARELRRAAALLAVEDERRALLDAYLSATPGSAPDDEARKVRGSSW